MANAAEKRLSARCALNIPAIIFLLAPDETFSPYRHEGRIQDISKGGMRLAIAPFARAQFQYLLQGPRYAQIRAILPGADSESAYIGNVVWIDFREQADPPVCFIGVSFNQLKEAAREALSHALETLGE